jgi:ferredoxin
MPKLFFFNTQQLFEVPKGTELLTAYKIHPDMPLKFGCTQGNCEVCLIKVLEGKENLSPLTRQEKITLKDKCQKGYRLACQCAIVGDVFVTSSKENV